MRPVPAVLAAALLVGVASTAWADPPTGKAQTVSSANAARSGPGKDPDEIVCVRQQEMNSRIPGAKECHTRRTWDQMTQDSRQLLQDMQNRNQSTTTMRGG